MPSILDYSRAPDNPVLPPGQIAEPDETLPYSERVKGAVDRHIATGGSLVDLARGIGRAVHGITPVGIGQAIGTDLAERPSEFPSLFSAAERQTRLVDNAFAQDRAREEAYDRRIKAVKDATGIELPNPERGGYQLNERELRALSTDGPIDPAAYRRQRFEQDLAAARVDHPDNPEMRFGDIDAEARAIAQGTEHDYDAARKDTGLSTASSLAMELGGGLWGQRRNPIQVGALLAGPTSAVGKSVAARIASSGLFQGLYNAGVAALEQPAVQAWRSELGLRSGLAPAAENVGLAFLFGAIPGAVFRGVHEIPAALRPSVKRVLDGAPEAGDIEKAMAAARSALGEIDAEMQPAARRAIKLGEDIDEAARATAPTRAKDVTPELHDDLEAAAARHAEDPVNQPSPAAVALVKDGERLSLTPRDISLGTGEEGLSRVDVTDAGGKTMAQVYVDSTDPKNIKIDIMGSDIAPNSLGPSQVRSLLRQLQEQYPDAETIGGFRTSGARRGKGMDTQVRLVPDEVEQRIAAAHPQTEREAQMAASEAIEDIGNRQTIARTTEDLARDRLPSETITGTAVRIGNDVFTGPSHVEAVRAAAESKGITYEKAVDLVSQDRTDQGFVTSTGRYVDRNEALQIADQAQQIQGRKPSQLEAGSLDAEMLEKTPKGKLTQAPASSKDPLDRIPLARDDGTPTVVSARQAARAGERETQFADLIRECK